MPPWGLVRICTASRWRRSTAGLTLTWPSLRRSLSLALEIWPIGIPGGYSDCSGPALKPAVTTCWPTASWNGPDCGRSWTQQLVGVADGGHEHAGVAPGVLDLGRDRHRVVGDQRDDRDGRIDGRDPADEAAVADHRVIDVDAVVGALVDLDRRVPQGRIAADHVRRDRLVGLDPERVVEADQLGELAVLQLRGLGAGELGRAAC